jgi:hypothetical protein
MSYEPVKDVAGGIAEPAPQELKLEKKRLKKLERRMETGVLTPWERYRALMDEMKHHTDLIEMADRKSRFGLVVLATLNAVNVVVVVRPDLLAAGNVPSGAALGVYVTFYAALSLFLCVQAITALKPRLSGPAQDFHDTKGVAYSESGELLSIASLSRQSIETYYELWQKAAYGQLNREVAVRIQVLARIIILKYRALGRLYAGLLVLVVMTGSVIVALTYLRLMD